MSWFTFACLLAGLIVICAYGFGGLIVGSKCEKPDQWFTKEQRNQWEQIKEGNNDRT